MKVDKDIQKGVIKDWERDPDGVKRELQEGVGDETYSRIMYEALTSWSPVLLVACVAILRNFEKEEREWKEKLENLENMDLALILSL